jgi:hypothetical protein
MSLDTCKSCGAHVDTNEETDCCVDGKWCFCGKCIDDMREFLDRFTNYRKDQQNDEIGLLS